MKWLCEVVRDNNKRQNAFALVLLALGAVASFCIVIATLGWTGLLSSHAANWVQAFGSIGAIFGAAWLADRSRRHGLEDRRLESLRREGKAINQVLMAATHTHTNLFHISLALSGNPTGEIGKFIRGAKVQAAILETALEGIEESLGIWSLAYMVSQETPAVCEEVALAWKKRGGGKGRRKLSGGYLWKKRSAGQSTPGMRAATAQATASALKSTDRVMQNAENVMKACRSYFEQAAKS